MRPELIRIWAVASVMGAVAAWMAVFYYPEAPIRYDDDDRFEHCLELGGSYESDGQNYSCNLGRGTP